MHARVEWIWHHKLYHRQHQQALQRKGSRQRLRSTCGRVSAACMLRS